MKTLFLYIDSDGNYMFFEKEGDYSHLNGVVVNISNEDDPNYSTKTDELVEILDPIYSNKMNKIPDSWSEIPSKDWDFFVQVGWFL